VQLQSAKERFEKKGIKLGAISYDSPPILKDFAERHKIEFPLLADPESKIIASYGVLNTEASGMQKGSAKMRLQQWLCFTFFPPCFCTLVQRYAPFSKRPVS
jgi:peroxiredoxin